MWMLKFILAPFLAVGAVLIVLAIFFLGFFCVMAGLSLLPKSPVLGWILFTFGVGIWLCMIGSGINAMFGGKE